MLFGNAIDAMSDCPACWHLRKVQFELKNGDKYTGYMKWNREWYRLDTTETFVKPYQFKNNNTEKTFEVFTDLRIINYPIDGYVVSITPPMDMPSDSLINFKFLPSDIKSNNIAGGIPVLSERSVGLLNTQKPVAVCKNESHGSCEIYWISYNPEIREDKLQFFCTEPLVYIIEFTPRLESNRIFKIVHCWD